jgi:hypothetical protein
MPLKSSEIIAICGNIRGKLRQEVSFPKGTRSG